MRAMCNNFASRDTALISTSMLHLARYGPSLNQYATVHVRDSQEWKGKWRSSSYSLLARPDINLPNMKRSNSSRILSCTGF